MSSQAALIQLCMRVSKGKEKECCAKNGRLCKQSFIELHGMASDNCFEKVLMIARILGRESMVWLVRIDSQWCALFNFG